MLTPAFVYLCSMKTCSSCNLEKSFDSFNRDKYKKSGYSSQCKHCREKYKEVNKEAKAQYFKEYYAKNKDERSAYRKAYYLKNKERELAKAKEYNEKNRDIVSAREKKYRERTRAERRIYFNNYRNNRRKFDDVYRLVSNVRVRVSQFCRAVSIAKNHSTLKAIGISPADFKVYIESHFVDGMNWDNYGFGAGKWSIDHTKPLCTANTEEEVFTLNHYTNLRPMWWFDNLSKGGKYQEQN